MAGGQVRVAVVGAGEVGRGWAALCAAHGWPVTLYDADARAVHDAVREVEQRARALVSLDHAVFDEAEEGLRELTTGRSLLQACQHAEWIIEAVPEDLIAKQKLFEALESSGPKARVVTSSSTGLTPSDISARCRRPDRCLVAHPMNPPELLPLVELLVSEHTDRTLLEVLKGWLRALGRIPVMLRKPVRGNVANRIAAAVWREAIDLVLQGAIDVADLDRAVSLGPGLAWASAGPHLTYHLAAGRRGVSGFLQHLLRTYEDLWSDLATWEKLEHRDEQRLIHAIERAYEEEIEVIREARDRRLAAMLRAMESAKRA